MVNTILAKRINHIVAKGDNPVWPKGSKSRGFSKYNGLSLLLNGTENYAGKYGYRRHGYGYGYGNYGGGIWADSQ